MSITYDILLPIFNKFGVCFSGGTATALRKSAVLEVGGFNENSLTEDADISIKIMSKGYKAIYVSDLSAKGEVPFRLNYFLRQQRRWSYGMVRTFIDNFNLIFFSKSLSILQKILIFFITFFSYLLQPAILIFFIFGQIAFVTGSPKPITLEDVKVFTTTWIITSGFLAACILACLKTKRINPLEIILPSIFLGIICLFNNTFSFVKALFKMEKFWFKTPKVGNIKIIKKVLNISIREL